MKSAFNEFYINSDKDMAEIWNHALLVIDANVLLNLYRYSFSTRDELLGLLEKFKNRLWLPHQVALEYHFNRMSVIIEQKDSYNSIISTLQNRSSDLVTKLDNELRSYKKRHPKLKITSIIESINASFNTLIDEIKEEEKKHPDLFNEDKVLMQITNLYDGRVGSPFSQEEINTISKEGERRFGANIPPGYKDDSKEEVKHYNGTYISSKYGDLILWKQIIDIGKEKQKPVIYVTDDEKEDWWAKSKGKTIGPRYELINEFYYSTQQKFYMYNTENFIKHASKYLKQQVNQEAITEVQEVRKQNYLPLKQKMLELDPDLEHLTESDWEKLDSLIEANLDDETSSNKIKKWLIKTKNLRQHKLESEKPKINERYRYLISLIPKIDLTFHDVIAVLMDVGLAPVGKSHIMQHHQQISKGNEYKFPLIIDTYIESEQIKELLSGNIFFDVISIEKIRRFKL